MSDISDKQSSLFEAHRDASQRFDYFIIALSCALFAYVGQNWRPTPLTISSGTFELLAVLLFAVSVAAGLKHRQYEVTSLKLNHGILVLTEWHAQFMSGSLGQGMVRKATGELLSPTQAKDLMESVSEHLPDLQKTLSKIGSYSSLAYIICNWALVLGFLVLVASKVLAAYSLMPF